MVEVEMVHRATSVTAEKCVFDGPGFSGSIAGVCDRPARSSAIDCAAAENIVSRKNAARPKAQALKGHGFSRAAKLVNGTLALAPEGMHSALVVPSPKFLSK
jgi:hypothetical protein